MIVEYEIKLYVTRPIEDGVDLAYYLNGAAKRALEHQVLAVCKRLDGDCDCEVMIAAAKEE